MKRSTRCKTRAPSTSPKTATKGPFKLIAGTIKLKEVAASITPAENPSIISSNLSEIRLVNNTGMAPAPVAKPATKLAMEPSQMISVLIVLSQLIGAHI